MSTSDIILMGMGNPLLDMSVDATAELVKKYELQMGNAILAEEKHMPLYEEIKKLPSLTYIAGGATQNSMRVAQWMLSASAGGAAANPKVAFMGCVGDDENGKTLAKCAGDDGVLVHYMVDADKTPTGTCGCLILDKERSLVANLAAANNFKPSHLATDTAKAIVEAATYYYCAGFFLTVSVESLVQVAEQTLTNDKKKFCLNLSAPFIVEFFADQVATALAYADYVFCNESEAEAYAKKNGVGGDEGKDLKAVATALVKSPKKNTADQERIVVITQGSQCTIVATGKAGSDDVAIVEYPVEPLAHDKIVDTNGAGDAFVGGFLAELTASKPIKDSVMAGHYAARYIIQQSGTTGLTSDKCTYYK